MPNWCSNSLKLTATTDSNRKLLDELEKQFDNSDKAVIFDMIKPTPLHLLDGQGWYDWRIKNWGHKMGRNHSVSNPQKEYRNPVV